MLLGSLFTAGSVLLGCLMWIPLSVWVVALVRWMVIGDVDAIIGILGIFLAVVLGYFGINPPSPLYGYVAFVGVASIVIMFPFIQVAMNKRSLRSIDFEDLRNAHEALRQRPDNWSAKFRIARMLYEMGYPGHALRIAESCIAAMPQAFFIEEHRLVNRWRMTPTHPRAFDPIPCIECSHPNPPGNVNCAACGAPFLLHRIQGKLLPSVLGKRLMSAWIVMVAVMVLLPLVASIGGVIAAIGILLLLGLAVTVLVIAFREPDKGVPA